MSRKQPRATTPPTEQVVLAPGVVTQLTALEEQVAALRAQHQLLTQTALLQAGVAGPVEIVGYDAKTRTVTVRAAA